MVLFMDPSSLSQPPPGQGLPLSNAPSSKPKTEPTTSTPTSKTEEIAKKGIIGAVAAEGPKKLDLGMQITDANKIQKEFYELAIEMGMDVPRKDRILFNLADSKADFDRKSKKVTTHKPPDIIAYLVKEQIKDDRFIERLKDKEIKYDSLKTYIRNLETFVKITRVITENLEENQGLITEKTLELIVNLTNKDPSNLFPIIYLLRNSIPNGVYIHVMKQLIQENLGDNNTPFFKGSIVLEVLKDEYSPSRFGRPICLDDFWEDDNKKFSPEAFFEKISLNVPDLLQTMADHLPRTTSCLEHFLKCKDKTLAWEVILKQLISLLELGVRSDIKKFLSENWPPDDKALKDIIPTLLEWDFSFGSKIVLAKMLSDLFVSNNCKDLQNDLNNCLLQKIDEILKLRDDELYEGSKGLYFIRQISAVELFPSGLDSATLLDLLIKKYEKIVLSKDKVWEEREKLQRELREMRKDDDIRTIIGAVGEETVTPYQAKREEEEMKREQGIILNRIKDHLEELKKFRNQKA